MSEEWIEFSFPFEGGKGRGNGYLSLGNRYAIIGIYLIKGVSGLDLKYELKPIGDIYEAKADRFCELYAIKMRMATLRAIVSRYAVAPDAESMWSMLRQSVAMHAFVMAQIIGPLYQEFLDLFEDKNIPVERLESEALHHDDAEALTGDAATDVDNITRSMKDAA